MDKQALNNNEELRKRVRCNVLNLLHDSGKSAGQIALKLKVSRQTVSQSLSGQGSKRVRIEVARTVKKLPSTLWAGVISPSKLASDDYDYLNG